MLIFVIATILFIRKKKTHKSGMRKIKLKDIEAINNNQATIPNQEVT